WSKLALEMGPAAIATLYRNKPESWESASGRPSKYLPNGRQSISRTTIRAPTSATSKTKKASRQWSQTTTNGRRKWCYPYRAKTYGRKTHYDLAIMLISTFGACTSNDSGHQHPYAHALSYPTQHSSTVCQ